MKLSVLIILFCLPLLAETDHLIGVPPNLDKYEISMGIESRSLQVAGTLAPPEAVINGKKVKLVQVKNTNMAKGVYVGKNKIETNGRVGRFYYELEPSNVNTDLIIVGSKSYKVNLSSKKIFIEKPFTKTIYLPKSKPAIWSLQGELPEGVDLISNNKKINKNNKVVLPISLEEGRHNLNIKIKSNSGIRTAYIPYSITKTAGKKNKLFLSVSKLNGEQATEVWDVPYYGLKLATSSNPNNKLSINNDTYLADINGNTSFKVKYNCNKKNQNLKINVDGKYGVATSDVKLKSSDCELLNKKHNSRFSFRIGLGHVGLVIPDYGKQRGLYSKHVGLGPMFSLGVRLYKKIYFEIRGGRTQAFHNSSGDYLRSLGGGSYWLGYPYRGRLFGAIGILNYTAGSYDVGDDPNFFGFNNTRATGIGLDGGYRWFISPSWVLSSRLTFTTTSMSFQENPSRIWPFYLIEPIGLEYYF